MSYLLQGTSSILAPCIGNLIGKELSKFAPCVCLRCTKLTTVDRGKPLPPNNRFFRQFHASPFSTNAPLQGDVAGATAGGTIAPALNLARNQLGSDVFRQQYFTSFTASLPLLGARQPVNVNLNFSCGPNISSTGIQYRFLHSSSVQTNKSSSKLEDTVIRLRERQKETLSELSKVEDLEKKIQTVIEQDEQLSKAVKVSVEQKKQLTEQKKSIWQRFVEECKHYYSGFKLLFLDVKVSSRIIWKVLHGKTLSRRENRQLVRTVSDLFRLVPFSVFIIVPFMELLLPVALKLFPGMLPSTFTSQDDREAKMRRALKAKLEYAKFLQQTLDDMGPTSRGYKSQSAKDFVVFYQSVKQEGAEITNQDILKFSKLFEDEITLDNMTRGQLVALCRLLELTPIGTNAFLRFQLEMQLRKLKADDLIISREGISSMSVGELQVACKERGMRASGLTQEKLSTQLNEWIELSTNEKVPPSLLLLSRTLYLPATLTSAGKIAAAVSALPETAATGAKAKIGEREGKIENVTRLEVIRAEQAKIEEEAVEQEKMDEVNKQKEIVEKEKQSRIAKEALERAIEEQQQLGVPPPPAPVTVSAASTSDASSASSAPSAQGIVTEAVSILHRATVSNEGEVKHTDHTVAHSDDIHLGDVIQEVGSKKPVKSSLPKELSTEDMSALKSAIDTIYKEKGNSYFNEHEVMLELRQQLTDYEEDLGELKEQAELSGRKDLAQMKGAARLFTRVNKMLSNIDNVVSTLQTRETALQTQMNKLEEAGASTGDQEQHLVTVHELIQAVRSLNDVSDSSRLERIGEVIQNMDSDSDGLVKVEHVNTVIELLGRDNVNLNPKQVKQIIQLIDKEEMLEVERRIEKVLGKIPIVQIPDQTKSEELIDTAGEFNDIAKELNQQPQEATSISITPKISQDGSESASIHHHHLVPDKAVQGQKQQGVVGEIISRPPRPAAVQDTLVEQQQTSTVSTESEHAPDNRLLSVNEMKEDNSVKEVTEGYTDSVAESAKDISPEKATRTNGSKH